MGNALAFTVLEASLSAALSTLFGAWLAQIWMRRAWGWKRQLEPLLLVPFFLPALFVVLAVVRVYGRSGLGLDVYGLFGIVIAHMMLNIPLAFFMILNAWRRVPLETIWLAESLGEVNRLAGALIWRQTVPQAFGLIFLFCTLSFTIVLTLGGGPSTTTLEVAIYQALRYQFDLGLATQLALLQALIGLVVYFALRKNLIADWPNAHELQVLPHSKKGAWIDGIVVTILALFLLAPVAWLVLSGVFQWPKMLATLQTSQLLRAMISSLATAFLFAIFVNALAIWLVHKKWDGLSWLIAAISPIVIATLLILILRIFINPFHLGVPLVILIQTITLCPIFVRIWRQALGTISPDELQMLDLLSASPMVRWRIFWWPRMRSSLARAFFMALTMGVGDLALYPLMAPAGFVTMPIQIWQLMGAYRFDAAMGESAVLIALIAISLTLGQLIAKHWEIGNVET